MVGVVVAASMDHQRVAFELIQRLQARCQHRLIGLAVAVHVERRQIAQVSVFLPGRAVLAGVLRVPVAARHFRRAGLAVLHAGGAIRLGMHMKAVQAGRQSAQGRGEDQSVGAFADLYLTKGFADAFGIGRIHVDVQGGRLGTGGTQSECRDQPCAHDVLLEMGGVESVTANPAKGFLAL